MPSERCSIEEQSIEYCGCCGVLCLVTWCAVRTTSLDTTRLCEYRVQILINDSDYSSDDPKFHSHKTKVTHRCNVTIYDLNIFSFF